MMKTIRGIRQRKARILGFVGAVMALGQDFELWEWSTKQNASVLLIFSLGIGLMEQRNVAAAKAGNGAAQVQGATTRTTVASMKDAAPIVDWDDELPTSAATSTIPKSTLGDDWE